jgi:hypothetical protein
VAERRGDVAVLGHTTGSHLDFSDEEKIRLFVIWRACVDGGKLACWQLLEDTAGRREQFALGLVP